MKVAVIDIGSNTIKLVNYRVRQDNSFTAYQQESTKVKLGESFANMCSLTEESMTKAIDTLLLYRDIIKLESIGRVICIGTSAVREAQNSAYFIQQVRRKTGFRIKVLSGDEEAYCSYLGTSMSTNIPNILFFDLGGGSLELVCAENFNIKKIESLPLGSLRLSQIFSRKDGSFTTKDNDRMLEHINRLLPTKKNLELNIDIILAGVGGTLRAIAKYDQESKGYPFPRLHNYRLSANTIESIINKLNYLKIGEISRLCSVDSSRAETIIAGSAVILCVMKKLDFQEVVVSEHGLREGVLAAYLYNPNMFNNNSSRIMGENIQKLVAITNKTIIPNTGIDSLIKYLYSHRLLRVGEMQILSDALHTILKLTGTNKLDSLFNLILDKDFPNLTHREQIVLALSIIYSKKVKTSEFLFRRYSSLLRPQNQKSMYKIGILFKLSDLILKSRSKIMVKESNNKLDIDIIYKRKPYPTILLRSIIQKFSDIFGVEMQYSLKYDPYKPTKMEKNLVAMNANK